MGGRLRGLGWGSLLLTILMVARSSAMGAPFHSSQYGYNLTLPDDWEQVPPDIQKQVMGRLWSASAKSPLVYEVAFQSKPHVRWFQYPYIMVEVMPYANIGLNRQINSDEFEHFVQAFDGTSIKKSLNHDLSQVARSAMSDPTIGAARLELGRRRFRMPVSMYVKGQGKIKGVMLGYFGHEAVVQVCFYARESQWEQQSAVAQPILNSFSFDPDKDYSIVAELEHPSGIQPSSQSMWLDATGKGFEGGIAGALIGGICWAVMRFFKSRA